MKSKKGSNPFGFVFKLLYYFVGFVTQILHPVSVEGLENLPKSGALLCANHSSNWDPVLIVRSLPVDYHLHVMAKEELFRIPVVGGAIRAAGAFPVSRGNMDIVSVKTALSSLQKGDNLLIFIEGTVVRDGIGTADGLPARAKSGAAVIGVRAGATLIPVFVDGEKKAFHRTRLIFGEPRQAVYTGRRGTAEEMQKIADGLLERAYALGGQAVGGKPL